MSMNLLVLLILGINIMVFIVSRNNLVILLLVEAVCLGLFLAAYGIKGGLIEKRMLNNSARKTYDTGTKAVQRGWFYIALGIILITIFALAITKSFH